MQGENITKAKLEIEKTLDTINEAFEKLFDSLFADVAMDVSADISVLQTLLAQEGLTKDDFSVKIDADNQLVVSMEKKEEHKDEDKKGRYLRREFSYSRFQQVMILPENVEKDKIDAKVQNGVLTIDIPKKQEAVEAKKVKEIAVK